MTRTAKPITAPRHQRGFTLIELMIVVVIAAILLSVAVPSYLSHVERTRRSDGQQALLDTAQRLERCFSTYGSYDHADCPVALPIESDEGNYEIASAPSTINAADFTLVADPQGAQTDDECGSLTLDQAGTRGVSGADAGVTADECWR